MSPCVFKKSLTELVKNQDNVKVKGLHLFIKLLFLVVKVNIEHLALYLTKCWRIHA